jgi:tRNA pseudouridine13 synthase
MKDRHAETRQWFSVRRAGPVDWGTFDADGVVILEQRRHQRKLRRGAHAGNAFRIALRAAGKDLPQAAIEQRLASIASEGVPNYFGEQRFGRDGGNLDLCRRLFAGRRLSRAKRSIALSAARALLFNAILAQRVENGSWNRILQGELANLDGSASVFAVDEVNDELVRRCTEKDIHPSGTLWGDASPRAGGIVAALEKAAVAPHLELADGLIAARMQPASRSLRLLVRDLRWQLKDDALWLEFSLAKGGYATAVLCEIAICQLPAVAAPSPPKRVAK